MKKAKGSRYTPPKIKLCPRTGEAHRFTCRKRTRPLLNPGERLPGRHVAGTAVTLSEARHGPWGGWVTRCCSCGKLSQ